MPHWNTPSLGAARTWPTPTWSWRWACSAWEHWPVAHWRQRTRHCKPRKCELPAPGCRPATEAVAAAPAVVAVAAVAVAAVVAAVVVDDQQGNLPGTWHRLAA